MHCWAIFEFIMKLSGKRGSSVVNTLASGARGVVFYPCSGQGIFLVEHAFLSVNCRDDTEFKSACT